MTKVYWNFCTALSNNKNINNLTHFDILGIPPIPCLKYISELKNTPYYLKCPAFTDFYENTFVILSPYDITISRDIESGRYVFQEFDDRVVENFVKNREGQTSNINAFFTMPPHLLFWSDSSVLIESFPTPFDTESQVGQKIKTIPGVFNIGKWYRSVDFSFEALTNNLPVIIKRGDPLFCIRLTPDKKDKIILEQTEITNQMKDLIYGFTGIKRVKKFLSLNKLYEIAKPIIDFYRKSRGNK